MKKYFFLAVLAFGVMTAQAQIGKLLDKAKKDAKALSGQGDDNTGLGLKEALNKGVESAVAQLSIKDGFFGSPYKLSLIHI